MSGLLAQLPCPVGVQGRHSSLSCLTAEATLLFGRGMRAGIDRREQKKKAAEFEADMLRKVGYGLHAACGHTPCLRLLQCAAQGRM